MIDKCEIKNDTSYAKQLTRAACVIYPHCHDQQHSVESICQCPTV